MFRQCPKALIAAREDEALTHGQVMYGLIKPTKDMTQLESTAAMINVIPKKRVYRMEEPNDLDLFIEELMKRPLVVQPTALIGRGIAAINCTVKTREERWVLLVNQIHPKVSSRLQMGLETAKHKMSEGYPFVLEITFNDFLQKIYLDHLTKAVLNKRFTMIEFEDAGIVIRYPGNSFYRNLPAWKQVKGLDVRFNFEDLLPSEITRRTVSDAKIEWTNPALRVIMPDELQSLLPGWGFENRDPMDGVEPPEEEEEMLEGAVGGLPDIPEEETQFNEPVDGKIVGRSRQKAQQAGRKAEQLAGRKIEVPVELHVPRELDLKLPRHGNVGPRSPHSPHSPHSPGARSATSRSPYEDLEHRNHNEHAYEGTRYGAPLSPHSPRSPHNRDYEEMNVSNQNNRQQSPHHLSPQQAMYKSGSPKTPTSLELPQNPGSQHRSSHQSPTNHTSPRMPGQYPNTDRYNMTQSDDRYNTNPSDRYNTGHGSDRYNNSSHRYKRDNNSADRYNENVNVSRPSTKTYLTDDDDGGFSQRTPRTPANDRYGNDNNYNQKSEPDRYGNTAYNKGPYNPSDRCNESAVSNGPRDNNITSSRDSHVQSGKPVAAPRGFHRQQGSGRSDTSTSDSGFGEIDYAPSNRSNNYQQSAYSKGGITQDLKIPYCNPAFENDPPENDMTDILAKHKALAAQMLNQNQSVPIGNTNYKPSDRYTDYKSQKSPRWQDQGVRGTVGSRSRLHSDDQQMEESFI